ncbi:MAG: hypothetical protein ACR2J3_00145 [Aridibacter sp.]
MALPFFVLKCLKMIKESFEEAKQNFSEFLIRQETTGNIVWLFHEDVIWQEKQVLINGRFSVSENEKLAHKLYENGKSRNLGIDLYAFCVWGEDIGCTIRLPEDEVDAGYKLMNNEHLKMSCSINPDKAVIIQNSLSWKLFKFLRFTEPPNIQHRKDLLPSKKNLQFSKN